MFRIELLPALHGDSILISYGAPAKPRRILIDGGPVAAYNALRSRMDAILPGQRKLELFVISHIDGDHIESAVRLLAEKAKDIIFDDVWFNGWVHLDGKRGILGPSQGEFLSGLIAKKIGYAHWNKAKPFEKGAIRVIGGELPQSDVSGMKLTVLSPTPAKLEKLRKAWHADVKKKGMRPGDLERALRLLKDNHRLIPKGLLGGSYQDEGQRFKMDSAVANGSSIAFMAEFEGKRCLFLADAHPDVIAESVRKLIPDGEKKLTVDAVKLAHHGSSANTTPELLSLIDCKRFLISTNGDIFGHPDASVVDMALRHAGPGTTLLFNYRSETTTAWADADRQRNERFTAVYPHGEGESLIIDL